MKKCCLRVSLTFSALFLLAGVCHATTVQRLALEDLIKRAHRIVVGKVNNARTYWSADRKLILTGYTIAIDENIKGQGPSTIEVTTVGGKIGAIELYVSGMPLFQKGEDAVVFVEQSGAYQTVVGLGQGKFTVANGEATNNVTDLSFPDGRPGTVLKMSLQNLKTRIRSALTQ